MYAWAHTRVYMYACMQTPEEAKGVRSPAPELQAEDVNQLTGAGN